MNNTFDVIVVGASLSGASAAIRLAHSGLKVALVDKASFPRRKPCGEGFSSFGLFKLEELGLKERILEIPHLEYSGYRITRGSSHSVIKSPWDGSITIQRSLLDAEIVRAAIEQPCITSFLNCRVTDIEEHAVLLGSTRLSAKTIIVASGSGSKLLKKIPLKETRTGAPRSGITATFKGEFLVTPRYINIILKKGIEIYCTPLAGGRLNVSILKDAASPLNLRDCILSNETIHDAFTECAFRGEIELPPEGRTEIGNVRRVSATPSIFLVGDAKEEFDPIGGMGMSHAISSGIQAADIIVRRAEVPGSSLTQSDRSMSTRAMRRFTTLSYRTLVGAKEYPFLLPLAASSVGHKLIKILTKDLACGS